MDDSVADLVDFSQRDHARFGTGWSIDDRCGEVGVGEMALVWARSGSGKSTMMLNVIAAMPEVPTLVVNMEMTPRRQIEWLAAMTMDFSFPARDIDGILRDAEDPRHLELQEGLARMGQRYPHLHFLNPNRPSVSDIAVVLDDIADRTGVRPVRVFVDHMGLMSGCTDYTGYVKTAGALHSLAMSESVALYVIQQTGRGGDSAGKNDGHLPVTLSSGVYAGEADADWIYGMYRPERDPRFKKSRHQFDSSDKYLRMLSEQQAVRGITMFQVIKNRPYSELCEDGIELRFDPGTRRLMET